jgi:hypothetical protein
MKETMKRDRYCKAEVGKLLPHVAIVDVDCSHLLCPTPSNQPEQSEMEHPFDLENHLLSGIAIIQPKRAVAA